MSSINQNYDEWQRIIPIWNLMIWKAGEVNCKQTELTNEIKKIKSMLDVYEIITNRNNR